MEDWMPIYWDDDEYQGKSKDQYVVSVKIGIISILAIILLIVFLLFIK